MSIITLRLPEKLLEEIESNAQTIHMPRSEYIRFAIEHMNNQMKNKSKIERIKKASLRVRKESSRINKEFSRIEHDPED